MDVQQVNPQRALSEIRSNQTQLEAQYSADLNLRTKEGDLVDLSFDSGFLLDHQESTTSNEGEYVQEISNTAVAASKYSFAVQGDLNEDELNAISELAKQIGPLAKQFFENGDFDLEKAADVLSANLGEIQEISLELERVIQATFSSQQTTQSTPSASTEFEQINPATQLNLNPPLSAAQPDFFKFPKIKDINELVLSVIDTEFPAQAVKIFGSDAIIKSIEELLHFLREQVPGFTKGLATSEDSGKPSGEEQQVREQEEPQQTVEV